MCPVKTHRHPARREASLAGFGLRAGSGIDEAAVDHDAALALAEKAGLTARDAAHLWLARHLGAESVTLDGKLAKAAATA